jgi:NhaA family Na+:H+ antiporter
VPLGIALGLFVGKQLGVFGFSWLALALGWARLPQGVTRAQIYGISVLCGIGFTMSLFIASLAFETGDPPLVLTDRLGILAGSLVSAVFGYFVLRVVLPGSPAPAAGEG